MLVPRASIAVRILLVGLVVIVGVAWSRPEVRGSAVPGPTGVTVASFGFSESITLAEIYSQAVEAAGIPVRRESDLGWREIVEPAPRACVRLQFTSDGHLDGDQSVLLQDDRGLQPPDNPLPVVRKEAVDRFGARLTEAADRVSSSLHTKNLTVLNRRVSSDGVKPARAVSDWLRPRGLF